MDEQLPLSIRQQIRTRVLNMSLGQWMRAVDLVLEEHHPRGLPIQDEAEHVTKLALLMMLTRWYDEEDICLLLDSSSFRIPKRLTHTGRFQLERILDRPPSGQFEVEDFDHDDDAPPGPEGCGERAVPSRDGA